MTRSGFDSWCKSCQRERSRLAKSVARKEGRVSKPTSEKTKIYLKTYREKKGDAIKLMNRAYQVKRRKDPVYRAMSNVGRRVRDMLLGFQGSTRHLPYDAADLKDHIQRQFTGEMNWQNYGSYWHIDHIIPITSFDACDPQSDDFQACWALSNLRPLSAAENLSKSDKITHLI